LPIAGKNYGELDDTEKEFHYIYTLKKPEKDEEEAPD